MLLAVDTLLWTALTGVLLTQVIFSWSSVVIEQAVRPASGTPARSEAGAEEKGARLPRRARARAQNSTFCARPIGRAKKVQKPASPVARKPANPQNPQARKPANPHQDACSDLTSIRSPLFGKSPSVD